MRPVACGAGSFGVAAILIGWFDHRYDQISSAKIQVRYYINFVMKYERLSFDSGVPVVSPEEEKYPLAIRAAIIIGASAVLWGLIALLVCKI
jgi:hypothetical protein